MTPYDDPDKLLAVLGSFWTNVYSGGFLASRIVHARAQLDAQAHLDLLELIASISRFNVPVFHSRNWTFLRLLQSQKNLTTANMLKFDGSETFREDTQYQFGVPFQTRQHCWTLPEKLVNVRIIMNRITSPSVTMILGVDFEITSDGTIKFDNDPFANELIPQREIFEDNTVVDREVGLWLYRGDYDWNTVYEQFGYALGFKMQSSNGYKQLVNAIYDSLCEGTTQRSIEDTFAALCGIPLAKETGEQVTDIVADTRKRWVITDKNAYGFSLTDELTVAVDDVLTAGQTLSTALRFYEFNRGQIPDDVRAVVPGRGMLPFGYFSGLMFENKTTPLIVEENVDGYTKLSFDIKGFPGDIEKFWDDLHAAGVAKGETLANLLDLRPEPRIGQPTAAGLPASINPLGFLAENVFRNNAFLVKIRGSSLGKEALGLFNVATVIRKIIPPQTLCMVLVELAVDEDPIILDAPGDDDRAGYAETVSIFLGKTAADTVDVSYVDETVRAFQISGHCQ